MRVCPNLVLSLSGFEEPAVLGRLATILLLVVALLHFPSLIPKLRLVSTCLQLVRIRVGSPPVCQQPAGSAPLVLLHPPELTLDQHFAVPTAVTDLPLGTAPAHPLPAVFAQRKPQEFINGHLVAFEKETIFIVFIFFNSIS